MEGKLDLQADRQIYAKMFDLSDRFIVRKDVDLDKATSRLFISYEEAGLAVASKY